LFSGRWLLMAAAKHLRMRHPASGGSGGGLYVSELQRARLLDATFAVVCEQGTRGMAVRAVAERAGVSSKTFYDLFADREDCFLAAFEHGVEQMEAHVRPAFDRERDWVAGIRASLGALLGFLDCEPALRRLVFVEALAAGPRVLERRAELLGELNGVVEEGQGDVQPGDRLPGVIAEGVIGATFGVIHARLLEQPEEPLVGLLNELMALIVLPYRGRAAAARELARPAPKLVIEAALASEGDVSARPLGSAPIADFRLTIRTQTVLAAVAEYPGSNNRRVAELAGISDQGQISRLMIRLQGQALLENVGGQGQGAPKAWRLTPDGEDVVQANHPLRHKHQVSTRAKRVRTSSRATTRPSIGGKQRLASSASRLTARTHLVLAAVSELGTRDMAPSNREIAQAAGVPDQGQISKLLARLEGQGLLRNTARRTQGIPNAWRLTPHGEAALHGTSPESANAVAARASR
jgi:AcrR family transcriptional regulator/DNA-binding MarR family transcriptional regulator